MKNKLYYYEYVAKRTSEKDKLVQGYLYDTEMGTFEVTEFGVIEWAKGIKSFKRSVTHFFSKTKNFKIVEL